ncbi:hypothetical protein HanIR_Chr02g0073161 [Helianthus annuus]|nr:hypothetical protein HanIR_Chr02g0073161 [Helianthus annuus]
MAAHKQQQQQSHSHGGHGAYPPKLDLPSPPLVSVSPSEHRRRQFRAPNRYVVESSSPVIDSGLIGLSFGLFGLESTTNNRADAHGGSWRRQWSWLSWGFRFEFEFSVHSD